MKRIICVAASILLATSAFAQRVELKVWESSGPEKEYVMWAARNYRKVNKNFRIVYEPVESTDARAKIELDGPAGVGADIFVTPHDHIGALVAGHSGAFCLCGRWFESFGARKLHGASVVGRQHSQS